MDLLTGVLSVAGLALLVAGADLLVRGASKLALAARISPLVVGLTVVAYGTSSPELAVSIASTLEGKADIALGNVVGSNIFNVLFILGLAALIAPLTVAQQLVRIDVPLMIGISLLLFLLGMDGTIGRVDGILLFAGLVAYTWWSIRASRKESADIRREYEEHFRERPGRRIRHFGLQGAFVVAGLALLIIGAGWLVDGAVAVARTIGASELVIGLTIVAAGTSLPEVATSIVASIRGERDIAVGNVVGSNIFNMLGVLGLAAILSPAGIGVSPGALTFDIPVMIAVAVACLPIFFTGHAISRWEGAVFMGYYAGYVIYLFFHLTGHEALKTYSTVMLTFVIPLTVVTLGIFAARSISGRGTSARR